MTGTTTQQDKGLAAVAQPAPPVSTPPVTAPAALPPPPPSPPATQSRWFQKWLHVPELWMLAAMLILAMVGMGVAQAFEKRGWLVWSFIAIAYGGISLWFGWRRVAATGESFWPEASRHIFHWLGLFLGLKVMFALEAMGFLDRIVVSDVALLMLALTCYFAGLHLQWMFFIVALFVGVMAYLNASFIEDSWLGTAFTAVLAVGVIGLLLKARQAPGKRVPRS